jgi:tetratricopeptide (TPR) repeat protein
MKAQKKTARRKTAGAAAAPEPAAWPPKWWYAAGAFALLYAGFQAYGSVLNGPFVFDDSYLLFRAPNFPRDLSGWLKGNRPLLNFSYWLNFQISQTDTLWYHIFNVLFHIANSLLVFLIVRKVLSYPRAQAGRATEDRQRLLLSSFAAGLFLLHPVQTESVAYVASRSESLSLLFFLSAVALFLHRRRDAVSWRIAAGVLILYGAAVSVKEHTVALIGVLLLTDYFWNPGFSLAGIRKNWRLYVPVALGAVAAGVFVWRVLARATTAGFNIKEFTWYQYFFTQCRAFFLYLRLVFLPIDQNADYQYPISRTIMDRGAIYGLIGIALLLALAMYFRKRYPLASYGFFVYVVLFAPTSSFVPIHDAAAERRLYLPMLGMLFMLVDLLQRLPVRQMVLAGALAAVLLTAGVLTYQRNQVWTSDVALWQDTVAKSPQNARAHFQLAYAYHYGVQRCDLAVQEYAVVDRIAGPKYDKRYSLLVDWGEAYECMGKTDEALAKLRQAAMLEPTAHAYVEIATICAQHDRIPESFQAFETAEKLDPNYAMLYVNRGALYQKLQQFLPAIANYRRALAIDPSNQPAAAGLAQAEQRARIRR